jgi:hypothetical protein
MTHLRLTSARQANDERNPNKERRADLQKIAKVTKREDSLVADY